MPAKPKIRSTTVICVRRDGKVVMAGDGQVTLGSEVLKGSAKKIRRLYNESILAGFAGSTADALSLFSRFEDKLQAYSGNLNRAAVAAATALLDNTKMSAREVAEAAMRIAAKICIYTNDKITIEELG